MYAPWSEMDEQGMRMQITRACGSGACVVRKGRAWWRKSAVNVKGLDHKGRDLCIESERVGQGMVM